MAGEQAHGLSAAWPSLIPPLTALPPRTFEEKLMPAPERYDLSVYERESLNLSLTLYTDRDGTIIWNLVGYTAEFRILDKPAGTVIATLNETNGITLGGSAGTIVVKRTPVQLAGYKIDRGAYDLVITAQDGTSDLLLEGTLEIVKT